ncbi:hypothetical protein BGZ60DRAFT_282218 [Tricladium varicosporioides]|nr:hypothetical protein BGZ60DRAFT_282218 [Hymenoscyphus varicosporioides]
MAPVDKKRKNAPTNDSFARSRNLSIKENRPAKRQKPDEGEKKITAPTKISNVREEEAAFPRGGASVLTPLEHKQIQIEATRDVLFEQQSTKSGGAELDAEENAGLPTKKKSKSKSKQKKGTEHVEPEEETVKIEGLSYKVF